MNHTQRTVKQKRKQGGSLEEHSNGLQVAHRVGQKIKLTHIFACIFQTI